jgi:predicted dehydrogenase
MTVRWGLIGCGDIAAKRVAAALGSAPNSSLVAVARRRADLAAEFAARHGAKRWHADWRDLVRDTDLDAVYIATPVNLHAEQTIAATEAGKHVLCEKPMALTPSECERMLDAARAHGVRLGVAYYRHHYPIVARLRDLISSGALGPPVVAMVQAFEMFDPPPDHPRAWFLKKEIAGGGPMFDFGCHRIEVLLDLLGSIRTVHGFPANVRFQNRDVEDTCTAHLGFESGAQATLIVSHAAQEPRDSFDIYCTQGSAHVEVLNKGDLRLVTQSGLRQERHPAPLNLHLPLVQDFVDAIREGREPAVTGEIGLAVARVVDAIYSAALSAYHR